uniref:Uncharacterized protein n=1 Tax=Oryza brachyantha TaxID=4533 RepID=J3N304_ORYBR
MPQRRRRLAKSPHALSDAVAKVLPQAQPIAHAIPTGLLNLEEPSVKDQLKGGSFINYYMIGQSSEVLIGAASLLPQALQAQLERLMAMVRELHLNSSPALTINGELDIDEWRLGLMS